MRAGEGVFVQLDAAAPEPRASAGQGQAPRGGGAAGGQGSRG